MLYVKAVDPQQTAEVAAKIDKFENTYKVMYGEGKVEKLFNFLNISRNVGLILIIGLLFTAMFLISNTIRITIIARKDEIEIMKLVGATNSFVRIPFVLEGMWLGILGSAKNVPGVRDYIAIDGGMSDNIRPALYDAKYEAVIANRASEKKNAIYTVSGKLCESGDKLMIDASLQQAQAGDILAMFCTGAYGYSMASNYNRVARPAVVFVEDGEHQLVIQRESYEHIVANDLPLKLKVSAK